MTFIRKRNSPQSLQWAAAALLACVFGATVQAATVVATVSFQQRNYAVSIVPLGNTVPNSNGCDLIFVILPSQQKYLAIPTDPSARGCFDPVAQRFYRVDRANSFINAFTQLNMTLINLDGTFFASKTEAPALNGNPQSNLESYSIPLEINTTLPADIAIFSSLDSSGGFIDGDTMAYRTSDTVVYEITRDPTSFVQRSTAIPEINTTASTVAVEVDVENDTVLLVQPTAKDASSTALPDRISSYTHGGQFFDMIELESIPGYIKGSAAGLAYDVDNGDLYLLDGNQLIVFTLQRPALTSVTPNHGPLNGANTVQVNGANIPSDAFIFFDGVQANNIQVKSGTQITCNPPAHAAGAVNITMTGTGILPGSPVTLVNGYSYGNTPPIAFLSATPNQGPLPLDVNFNIDGSTDIDGTLVSRVIDFGDGSSYTFPSDLGITSVTHTYNTNATFTATLTVTDDMGATAKKSAIIIVGKGGEDLIETLVLRTLAMKVLNIKPPDPPDPAHPAARTDSIRLTGEVQLPEGVIPPGLTLSIAVNGDTVTSDNLVIGTKNKITNPKEKFTIKPKTRPGTPANTYSFTYAHSLINLYAAKPDIPPGTGTTRVTIPVTVQFVTLLGRSLSYVKDGVNQAVVNVRQSKKGSTLSLVRK